MQSGFYVIRELWQPGFCKTAPHYVSLLLSLSYCLALLLNLLMGFDYNYSSRCRTNTFVPFYISEVQNPNSKVQYFAQTRRHPETPNSKAERV